jgi:hypothetical protein
MVALPSLAQCKTVAKQKLCDMHYRALQRLPCTAACTVLDACQDTKTRRVYASSFSRNPFGSLSEHDDLLRRCGGSGGLDRDADHVLARHGFDDDDTSSGGGIIHHSLLAGWQSFLATAALVRARVIVSSTHNCLTHYLVMAAQGMPVLRAGQRACLTMLRGHQYREQSVGPQAGIVWF